MYERHRFHTDPDDYRPVAFPPPGPYWCTGRGAGYSVCVAYLPKGEPLTRWWPDATSVETEQVEVILFTDRFPKPDWYEPQATGAVRPTTLQGLKLLAKHIGRSQGIQHAKALDLAAQQAGYESFYQARKALGGAA